MKYQKTLTNFITKWTILALQSNKNLYILFWLCDPLHCSVDTVGFSFSIILPKAFFQMVTEIIIFLWRK